MEAQTHPRPCSRRYFLTMLLRRPERGRAKSVVKAWGGKERGRQSAKRTQASGRDLSNSSFEPILWDFASYNEQPSRSSMLDLSLQRCSV
jgi:hypothetical protein